MHASKGMDTSTTNQEVIAGHFDGNTNSDVAKSPATQPPTILQQQPQPLLDDRELREKIVEILSNTANGCLIELGYYPGITQKLKQLEATNVTWQTENVKLYDDNRRLLETVRGLQEKLRLVSIPEIQKLDRIRQLELELQALRVAATRQHPQEGLQKEFSRLKEAYAHAFHEVKRLTALLQSQSVTVNRPSTLVRPSQRSALVQSPYQNTQAVQLQQLNSAVPQVFQRQMQVPSGAWHGGQPHPPSATTAKHLPGRLPLQHPLQQTQIASLKQRQGHGTTTSNPQLRRPSTVASIPMHQQSLPQTMHGQNLPLHVDQLRRTTDQTPLGFHSRASGLAGPLTTVASNIPKERPASNPSTPVSTSYFTPQPMVHPVPRKFPPNPLPNPAPRTGSAPMALDSSMSTNVDMSQSTTFTSFHEQGFSAPSNVPPTHPPPFDPLPQVRVEREPPPMPMVTSVTPNDIHMQPPNSTMYEALQWIAPCESHMQSASPDPMVTTVSPQDLHIQPSISRKRGSSYTSDEGAWEEGPDKRPRYDSHHGEAIHGVMTPQPPPMPVQTVFGPVPTETLDPTNLDFSTEMSQGLQSGVETAGLDPDGLRILRDWIEEVFEFGNDGARVCRLCLNRYQQNYMSEPPSSFVDAPDEVLEEHCLTEHEQAWLMLRQAED